jgi:hypothetical protein
MDANVYLLIFFGAMLVLSVLGLGLTLLVDEDEVPEPLQAVRRDKPVVVVAAMANAPSCRYRKSRWREHLPDGAAAQRSRLNRI